MAEDKPTERLHFGFLIFPRLTQLDMTAPYDVLTRVPQSESHLIWKSVGPVKSELGLTVMADTSFADCPRLDLLCVPGGPGINPRLTDTELLRFLREAASQARWVTAVCTGALLLGAAGLLRGQRATTHWMSHDLLAAFGATPVKERVVTDGNLITGAGVTAGLDLGLSAVAAIAGRHVAEQIQLGMEYDPHPPFDAGSPDSARPEIVAAARNAASARQAERNAQVTRAAAALHEI